MLCNALCHMMAHVDKEVMMNRWEVNVGLQRALSMRASKAGKSDSLKVFSHSLFSASNTML